MAFFPFHDFFSNAPVAVFTDKMTAEEAWTAAEGCFRHLQYIFTFLDECRAFEILRTYQERAKYLVTTQAKIIAMTCTHAALKRHDFVAQGFEFDSLVMEEAAQILESETFIPMLLQQQRKGKPSRLKRVVLIGDHNQVLSLPPLRLPPPHLPSSVWRIGAWCAQVYARVCACPSLFLSVCVPKSMPECVRAQVFSRVCACPSLFPSVCVPAKV